MAKSPRLHFSVLVWYIFTIFSLLNCLKYGESKKFHKRNRTETLPKENATMENALMSELESLIHLNVTEESTNELNTKDADFMLNNLTELIDEVETEANSTYFNQSATDLIWGQMKDVADKIIQLPENLKPFGEKVTNGIKKIHKEVTKQAVSIYDYVLNKSVFGDIYRKVKSFFNPRDLLQSESRESGTGRILLAGEKIPNPSNSNN